MTHALIVAEKYGQMLGIEGKALYALHQVLAQSHESTEHKHCIDGFDAESPAQLLNGDYQQGGVYYKKRIVCRESTVCGIEYQSTDTRHGTRCDLVRQNETSKSHRVAQQSECYQRIIVNILHRCHLDTRHTQRMFHITIVAPKGCNMF